MTDQIPAQIVGHVAGQASAMTARMAQDLAIGSPLLALFMISLIPLLIKVVRGNREPNPFSTLTYGILGLVVAAGLTVAIGGGVKSTLAFSDAIVFDGISVWMSCLVYFIAGVALMLGYDHVLTRGRQFSEWTFLMLSSTIGMIILLMANDLIIAFIGIETMSLCLYILVAMSKEEVLSKEASFKYFVLGSFASAIFLYGIALIYGTVGATTFPRIAEQAATLLTTNRLFLVGMSMTILGFAFKVSLFPLHSWTPDVYQGAPTPLTAFMSTAVKAATFVAFLRFFHIPSLVGSSALFFIVTWIAALTMIVGNVAAVMQDNLKRMLAYSSVAHSGYAFLGLIAAGFGDDFERGASALLFYLFSYSLMTLGSFALVALYEKTENASVNVQDLRGLGSRRPWLALSFSILMLSLAGIPPTLGFFGKFYVFTAVLGQDMSWLAIWAAVGSMISVYYYLRPIVTMYMSDDAPAEILDGNLMTKWTLVASAALIVVLGIFSSPVTKAIHRAVQTTSVNTVTPSVAGVGN